jgi:hypothetical protein
VIESVTTLTSGPAGVMVTWHDNGSSGGHQLVVYTEDEGKSYSLSSARQPVTFSGTPKLCFVVVDVPEPARRSVPMCINGGTPALVR